MREANAMHSTIIKCMVKNTHIITMYIVKHMYIIIFTAMLLLLRSVCHLFCAAVSSILEKYPPTTGLA